MFQDETEELMNACTAGLVTVLDALVCVESYRRLARDDEWETYVIVATGDRNESYEAVRLALLDIIGHPWVVEVRDDVLIVARQPVRQRTVEVVGIGSDVARLVLIAACGPFGSLFYGDERVLTLVEAILDWGVSRHAKSEVAERIVAGMYSAGTDQLCRVELGMHEVTLVTPTSGTRITCSFRGNDVHDLYVDFGAQGSASRADDICAHLRAQKIHYTGALAGEE